jgi:hypothetical protein
MEPWSIHAMIRVSNEMEQVPLVFVLYPEEKGGIMRKF